MPCTLSASPLVSAARWPNGEQAATAMFRRGRSGFVRALLRGLPREPAASPDAPPPPSAMLRRHSLFKQGPERAYSTSCGARWRGAPAQRACSFGAPSTAAECREEASGKSAGGRTHVSERRAATGAAGRRQQSTLRAVAPPFASSFPRSTFPKSQNAGAAKAMRKGVLRDWWNTVGCRPAELSGYAERPRAPPSKGVASIDDVRRRLVSPERPVGLMLAAEPGGLSGERRQLRE